MALQGATVSLHSIGDFPGLDSSFLRHSDVIVMGAHNDTKEHYPIRLSKSQSWVFNLQSLVFTHMLSTVNSGYKNLVCVAEKCSYNQR